MTGIFGGSLEHCISGVLHSCCLHVYHLDPLPHVCPNVPKWAQKSPNVPKRAQKGTKSSKFTKIVPKSAQRDQSSQKLCPMCTVLKGHCSQWAQRAQSSQKLCPKVPNVHCSHCELFSGALFSWGTVTVKRRRL
jgi:hypothetical protein